MYFRVVIKQLVLLEAWTWTLSLYIWSVSWSLIYGTPCKMVCVKYSIVECTAKLVCTGIPECTARCAKYRNNGESLSWLAIT